MRFKYENPQIWRLVVLAVWVYVFALSASAFAQHRASSIIGQVTDESGGVLPGERQHDYGLEPAFERDISAADDDSSAADCRSLDGLYVLSVRDRS
jgi:hypothetical protein